MVAGTKLAPKLQICGGGETLKRTLVSAKLVVGPTESVTLHV